MPPWVIEAECSQYWWLWFVAYQNEKGKERKEQENKLMRRNLGR